ncbi:MAG: hypothetical protein MJ116_02780 [Lachnospiraceae bacterium]|nr:hypothetical protein [Lachnospiraceae bacterium]
MEGRIRSRRTKFSQISNGAIDNLDPVSLWLYVKMYSKANIPEFKLYKKNLERMAKDNGVGRDRFNRAWANLIKEGYIKQYRFQNEKGHFYYEYEVLEEPEPAEEKTEEVKEAGSEKNSSDSGEPVHSSPLYGYPYSGQPYSGQPLDGNLYPINNTINNNTRINNTGINNTSSSTSPSDSTQTGEDDGFNMEWYETSIPLSVRADKVFRANRSAVLQTMNQAAGKELSKKEQKRILEIVGVAFYRKEQYSGAEDGIKKPFAYYLKLVEAEAIKVRADASKTVDLSRNNRFHNFHQRDYDYDQLEHDLLASQW